MATGLQELIEARSGGRRHNRKKYRTNSSVIQWKGWPQLTAAPQTLLHKIFLQTVLKASSQAVKPTACTRGQYKMDHSTGGPMSAACEN